MGTLASHADPGTAASTTLLAGDAGTAQTIALMDQIVEKATRDPLVRAAAGQLIAGIEPNDLERQAKTIWNWFVAHVHFVRDGVGQEVVSDAAWTLRHGFGDCDDMVIALRGLLGSVGIVSRTVTVATNPGDDAFTHVYLEAQLGGGRWVPLDPARPHAAFGVTSSRPMRRQVWEDPHQSGLGMGLAGYGLPVSRTPGMGTVVWGTRQDMGRLGQEDGGDGIDWGSIASLINAGGTAAANIITAARQDPRLLYGLQQRGLYPQSAGVYGQGGISIGAMSPTTLLLFGGLGLVLVLKR